MGDLTRIDAAALVEITDGIGTSVAVTTSVVGTEAGLVTREGRAGQQAMDQSIPVTIASNQPGSLKMEDSAHIAGSYGAYILGLRNDSASTTFTSTNGDYSPIAVDSQGRVFVTGTLTISGGTQTVVGTVTSVPSGTQTVTGSITTTPPVTQTVAGTVTSVPSGTQVVSGTVTSVPTGTQTVTGTVTVSGGVGGGGVSYTDKSGFTEGSGSFTPIGGVYNETISSDPTEDQTAAARITAKRAVHVNLRGSSGTELLGQQTMASSVPVVLASNQPGATYAEDSAHVNGDHGAFIMGVRNDSAATLTSADGDYSPIAVDAQGHVYVTTSATGTQTVIGTVTSVPSGTQTITGSITTTPAPTQTVVGTVTSVPSGTQAVIGFVSITSTTGNQTVVGTVTSVPTGTQTITGSITTTPAPTQTVVGSVTSVPSGTQTITGSITTTPAPTQTVVGTVTSVPSGTQSVIGFVSITSTTGNQTVVGTVTSVPSGTQAVSGSVAITSTTGTQTVVGTVTSVASSGTRTVAIASTTGTQTITGSVTSVPSGTQTITGSITTTPAPTQTVVGSVTSVPSGTQTITGSITTTPAPTQTVVGTVTSVPSGTQTITPSGTQTITGSITTTPAPTQTVVGTVTSVPSGTQTITGSITTTPAPTQTVVGTVTSVPSGTQAVIGSVSITSTTGTQTVVGTVTSVPSGTQTVVVSGTVTTTGGGGGGGVTQFAEDSSHTTGDLGSLMLAVRNDSLAVTTSANGDYSQISVDSAGRVFIAPTGTQTVAITSTTGTQTVTGFVSITSTTGNQTVVGTVTSVPSGTQAVSGSVAITSTTGTQTVVGTVTSVASSGTRTVAIASTTGTRTVVGTVTSVASSGTRTITGDVAHDSADSGNPIKIGGQARQSNQTAASNGDRVNIMCDDMGRQVVIQNHVRDLVTANMITLTATTETTLIAAGGSGVFHDLVCLTISNWSSSNVRVDIRDTTAGTVRMSFCVAAAGGGAVVPFSVPLPQTSSNTNWTAQLDIAATDIRVFAQAVKNA